MKPTSTLADTRYMAKRGLRRYAGAWHLWATGVGAVISGDFFGWNYGLAARGFGGVTKVAAFPTWLSVTHGMRRTPHRALVAGAALGPVGAILLNMALRGGLVGLAREKPPA